MKRSKLKEKTFCFMITRDALRCQEKSEGKMGAGPFKNFGKTKKGRGKKSGRSPKRVSLLFTLILQKQGDRFDFAAVP